MIHLKIWWLSSIAGAHTYLGFPTVGVCCIYHFCDFIVKHSLQFEAAARAQAAANPNLRHIGGPLGPAQMMAMAQSREAQEKDARTMALLQYEAIMRAGQPPLPSGPMAVAGNYFSYKITYSAHWILKPWM